MSGFEVNVCARVFAAALQCREGSGHPLCDRHGTGWHDLGGQARARACRRYVPAWGVEMREGGGVLSRAMWSSCLEALPSTGRKPILINATCNTVHTGESGRLPQEQRFAHDARAGRCSERGLAAWPSGDTAGGSRCWVCAGKGENGSNSGPPRVSLPNLPTACGKDAMDAVAQHAAAVPGGVGGLAGGGEEKVWNGLQIECRSSPVYLSGLNHADNAYTTGHPPDADINIPARGGVGTRAAVQRARWVGAGHQRAGG